jgi:DNA (cytosine-5)-methyltransferase 3A
MTYTIRPSKYIIEGREVNQHNTYQIRFKTHTHPQDRSFFDKDMSYSWSQITSITTEEKQTIVYNMEVEEDNSYTANGVVVHNCQNLSNAGNGTGLEGSESGLFYRYLEILNHIKSVNPNVKFLLENVVMKKEWEQTFNDLLGVKPILIDSAIVSAQRRKRLYWTNIEISGELEDKNLTLKDIVEPIEDKVEFNITDKMYAKKEGTLSYKKAWGSVKTLDQKSKTLTCSQSIANSGATNIKYPDGQFYKPTALESERLQTLPDNYTKYGVMNGNVAEISYTQRVKCVGNGWTAEVIKFIFRGLK